MPSPYLEFKLAHTRYGKAPAALSQDERHEVSRIAARQSEIERRVLACGEAGSVLVPEETLRVALGSIRTRYADDAEFEADLARHGLSSSLLQEALRRELAVDAVLERVAAQAPAVTDVDAELFYRLHPEHFVLPERRRMSHILITINDAFPENTREAARARIEAVAARLAREPGRFGEQAAAHSECPSALQGGMLGEYAAGQLFPALEQALFALWPGHIGGIVETPLGFHLPRCDAVLPPAAVAFADVLPRIREMLTDARARAAQRLLLRQLMGPGR